MAHERIVIYQVFTRLFGNDNTKKVPHGTKSVNGCGRMSDFTLKALKEIHRLGTTHIWYTGIIEHATQTHYTQHGIQCDHPAVVKGKAGSPYAIKDYYDVDPDLATKVPERMKEFELLVERTHKARLKCIIDFVPNHVARQYHSDASPSGTDDLGAGDNRNVRFSPNNNFYYIPNEELHSVDFDLQGYHENPAKATGNDVMHAWPEKNDWYETVKLNYGVDYDGGRVGNFSPIPDTWHKMLAIVLFWAKKGVDAFRCDMAEMVPVEFWQWMIPAVKAQFPNIIFIAEVYNPAEYRNYIFNGHFDYLYDKVGMYDDLRAVARGEASTQCITQNWQNVDDIREHMLYFLENHDEQRLASNFFAADARKGRAPLLVCALLQKNPIMIYFGQELGERGMEAEGFSGMDGRTTIFDYWCVDTIRRWRNRGLFDGKLLTEEELALQDFYRKVLTLCNTSEAVQEGEFHDLMYANAHLHEQYAFVRHTDKECIVVVANFSSHKQNVHIHLPAHLFECLNGVSQDLHAEFEDLLTGKKLYTGFTATSPMSMDLPAWSGAVWKLKK